MATFDTVEFDIRVRMRVMVGGAYEAEQQYDGQMPDADGLYRGPTQREAVTAELAARTLALRGRRWWQFWAPYDFAEPEILGVSTMPIKTVKSEYVSGE